MLDKSFQVTLLVFFHIKLQRIVQYFIGSSRKVSSEIGKKARNGGDDDDSMQKHVKTNNIFFYEIATVMS